MVLDPEKFNQLPRPLPVVTDFFENVLTELNWKSGLEPETVLDIGCGPGRHTHGYILPFFPNVEKVIGVDLESQAIEFARQTYSHPKIEFHTADIEDWSAVQQFEGQITKCTSNYVFHWLRDQRKAFDNVFRLLRPGGEAALLFPLYTALYEAMEEMTEGQKWGRYFEGVFNLKDHCFNKYDVAHIQNTVTEAGFHILYCEEEFRANSYPSDQEFKDFFCALVPVSCLPEEQRAEFEEEFFQKMVKAMGRNEEGLPVYSGKEMKLVIRKPTPDSQGKCT